MSTDGFEDDRPKPVVKLPSDFLRTKPRKPGSVVGFQREWRVVAGVGYELKIPDIAVEFTLTRVRARFEEVTGLLTVRAKFAGAKTVGDAVLSSADFNLSSLRARQERAKHLDERALAPEIDWLGLVEELCHRVLDHEERGEPIVPLHRIQPPEDGSTDMEAGGLPLLRRLPTIWFGDGGCGKSYLSLYAAIDLAQLGENVLYCDWEFAADDHALRLRQLLGPSPSIPNLFYRRCSRPLTHDVNFLKQSIHDYRISFLVCDSVGFACGGAPEESDSALKYFAAVRELGSIGSLHIAHISKAEQGDQKPFGSVFWSNGARSIWYVKRSETEPSDTGDFSVGMVHRKANTGRLQRARALRFSFLSGEVRIFPTDIGNHADLSEHLPIWQRISACLKQGPMTSAALAQEIGAKETSVARILTRHSGVFTKVLSADGIHRFGLVKSVS